MAIPEVSQQSYEFQDAACVEIMLRFADVADSVLRVEPPGGEDAELSFRSRDSRFDIQVKHSKDPVTLETLASWLAHAPPLGVEPTLLERLIDDPRCTALFFASGRCADAVVKHLPGRDWSDWKGEPPRGRFVLGDAKALAATFVHAKLTTSAGSELTTKRKTHNAALLKRRTPKEILGCLGRILVREQIGFDRLRADCAEALVERSRVPRHLAPKVVRELEDVVKRAKKHRGDAYPEFREVVRKAAPRPLLPPVSVPTGRERELARRAENDGVLLLGGVPRCGKSHLARLVGVELQNLGYDAVYCGDRIEEAERYLYPVDDPIQRVVLLDDPLGGAHATSEPTSRFTRLFRLAEFARAGRLLLIVSQSQDFLFEAVRVGELGRCRLAGFDWIDLSLASAEFLRLCWQAHAARRNVESGLKEWVERGLAEGRLALSPGQIDYLAANAGDIAVPSIAEIDRVAKGDATVLGASLRGEGFGDVLVPLAVASAPGRPIASRELAFVTKSENGELPTYFPRPDPGTSCDPVASCPVDPAYELEPQRDPEAEAKLERLETRGILSIEDGETVEFRHPFYRAAAESLIDGASALRARRVLAAIERGVFCPAPATCLATASNLEWIYARFAGVEHIAKALLDLARKGLDSRYLGVRDHCLLFLLRHLDRVPEAERDVEAWIRHSTHVLPTEVEWDRGFARLPEDFHFPRDPSFGDDDDVERTEREPSAAPRVEDLAALRDPDLVPEQAAKALAYLELHPASMSPADLVRASSLDEAFLRAAAYRIWLTCERADEREQLDRMLADDHPTCAFAVLHAAAQAWPRWKPKRRKVVRSGLVALARSMGAAYAMGSLLTAFDQDSVGGKSPPWTLFATLLEPVLATLPPEAYLNEEGLDRSARAACQSLGSRNAWRVCESLIRRLEARLGRAFERRFDIPVPPVGHSFGIAGLAVDATKRKPQWRDDAVRRLLAVEATGAAMRFVADLADRWDFLTREERDLVLERTMERPDRRWLEATAITRERVPAEVESRLLGGVRLAAGAQAVIEGLDAGRLSDALVVHWRRHPALAHLGLRERGRGRIEIEPWDAITRRVAADPDHPLFSEALAYVAFIRGTDGLVEAIEGSNGGAAFLRPLCTATVVDGYQKHRRAWNALLRTAPDQATYGAWLDEAARCAPAFLDGGLQCCLWLADRNDVKEMERRFRSDIACYRLAEVLVDPETARALPHMHGPQARRDALRCIEEFIDGDPPRLARTCERLLDGFRQARVRSDLTLRIERLMQGLSDENEVLGTGLRPTYASLDDWFGWPWIRGSFRIQ